MQAPEAPLRLVTPSARSDAASAAEAALAALAILSQLRPHQPSAEPVPLSGVTSWDQIPLKIGVKQIAEFFGIGLGKAYQLLRRDDFPARLTGNKRRVVYREDLRRWVEAGGSPWQIAKPGGRE